MRFIEREIWFGFKERIKKQECVCLVEMEEGMCSTSKSDKGQHLLAKGVVNDCEGMPRS